MGNIARMMMKESIDAFVKDDSALARKVLKDDDLVDDLMEQVFRELLSFMIEDPHTISRAIRLSFIAKYLDMLVISGQVEVQQYGPAKVYFPSQRIPVSAMIEITSDLVMVLDQDHKIVHVNKPFTLFLDVPREHLVGKTPGEVAHPFLSSIPVPSQQESPGKENPGISEVRYDGRDGELTFRLKQAPAVFEDGSVGLTLILEDITEQKRYQETLRLSEARYRGIVEDQTEFICRFLPDGTHIFANEAYCRYFSRGRDEIICSFDIVTIKICHWALDGIAFLRPRLCPYSHPPSPSP
jgi:PAS domain S-box-containing protein